MQALVRGYCLADGPDEAGVAVDDFFWLVACDGSLGRVGRCCW